VVTSAQARAIELRNAPRELPENLEHTRLWQLALPALVRAGGTAVTVASVARDIGVKEAVLHDVLHRRAGTGDAVRLPGDKFMLRPAFDDYVKVAHDVALGVPEGRFTAAEFRDAAGVGRGFAIQLLEAMDRLGLTRRIGETRVMLDRPEHLTGYRNSGFALAT
jgi:selenocysteine-specific elongation factor